MRLALIRVLSLLLPLFLIALAVYICEMEFCRLFGACLIEFPSMSARSLPSPRGHVRRLLGPPSSR